VVVLALVTSLASAAVAQPRDPAGSQWLFREGRNLMKQGDLVAACPKLAESLRLDPAVGTLMNLAECEERQGRTASAWQRWAAAADQLPANDRRRATALARARALEAVLPRLVVTSAGVTAGLVVERDGMALGPASLGVPLPVDPGLHLIVASAPGRQPRTFEITAENGQLSSAAVEPGPAPATAPQLPPIPPPAITLPAAPRRTRPGRVVGYSLVTLGATALGAGAYFGLQALSARREADGACAATGELTRCRWSAAPALDRDRRWSRAADVAFAAGAVATAAGLYLILRKGRVEPTLTAQLQPVPAGGGAQLAGRF
jgi:hypothetical protein